jgi:hypothetical protein
MSGKTILPANSESIDLFIQKNVIQFKQNGKLGWYDTTGTLVGKNEYDELSEFNNGFAMAMKVNKYGIINQKNEIVVNFDYELVKILEPNFKLGTVKKNFTWYLFHLPTKQLIDYKFVNDVDGGAENPTLINNRMRVSKNGLFGYIDEDGEMVINCQFKKASHFNESTGKAKVSKDGKTFFNMDTEGDLSK